MTGKCMCGWAQACNCVGEREREREWYNYSLCCSTALLQIHDFFLSATFIYSFLVDIEVSKMQ